MRSEDLIQTTAAQESSNQREEDAKNETMRSWSEASRACSTARIFAVGIAIRRLHNRLDSHSNRRLALRSLGAKCPNRIVLAAINR